MGIRGLLIIRGLMMSHKGETTIIFSGRSFNLKVVEDVDYLLGLVETDDDVPFWAVLWPAAIGMAEYFWEKVDFSGKRVLELGAGLGLAGIVAASRNADIVQTDFIPEALKMAQENARLNGINNIIYSLEDWRKFSIKDRFDWIIGSDILYEPKLYPYLKRIFRNNLKPGGTIVLSDPGRDNVKSFITEMSREGYRLETVSKSVFEAGRNVHVTLYFLSEN